MILAVLLSVSVLNSEPEALAKAVLQRYSADGVHDSSSLVLYEDQTFTYQSRGGSRFAWQDWQGTWSKMDNLLYLRYSITIDDSQERISRMATVKDSSRVSVSIRTAQGAPVAGAIVSFDDQAQASRTGADGQVYVSYEDIRGPNAAEGQKGTELEQLTVDDGKHTVTFKIEKPFSNYFEVVLDPTPPSHQEWREDVYRVKEDRVVLVRDGVPEHAQAFGERRPRVLRVVAQDAR